MQINERLRPNIAVMEPNGRLTAETASVFTDGVGSRLDAGWINLIVDLDNVNYIDSAGLGALVHAYTSARRRGGRMVLVHVHGKNKNLLTITKLLTVFDVYDSEAEAEGSFGHPPQASVA